MFQYKKTRFRSLVMVVVFGLMLYDFRPSAAQNSNQVQIQSATSTRARLADLLYINSIRSNQLSGYGLVIGLNGTGDSRSLLAKKSMEKLLSNLGQSALNGQLTNSKNVAAVLVTVDLPPFIQNGQRLDAVVSSIGDARSLANGVLVQTPLYAANGQIYAVAQGGLQDVGNRRTVAHLSNGVISERNVKTDLFSDAKNKEIRLTLKIYRLSILHQIKQLLQQNYSNIPYTSQGSTITLNMQGIEDPQALLARLLDEETVIVADRPQILIYKESSTILLDEDLMIKPLSVMQFQEPARAQNSTINTGIFASIPKAARKDVSQAISSQGMHLVELLKKLRNNGLSIFDIQQILNLLKNMGYLNADITER